MKNSKSSGDKSSNNSSNDENIQGYIPRKCDLNCYKCRYQGVCVIPRRLIEERKRFIRNNMLGLPLTNDKYRLNDFPIILGYKKKFLKYLNNLKKKKHYNKNSE